MNYSFFVPRLTLKLLHLLILEKDHYVYLSSPHKVELMMPFYPF